jgi:L-lactate oxidase
MKESLPAGLDIVLAASYHGEASVASFGPSINRTQWEIWRRIAMNTSRREIMEVFGASAAALVATGRTTTALAEEVPALRPDLGNASTAEGELKIVNFDILEEDAKRILSPGRFAFMGPAGDGWTYRENRRAFNDFPIMPRRLQGISTIDLRIKLLGHDLPFPIITAPMGAQGMIHVNADLASAGGTGMAGTLYVSSGASTKPMEDIAQATPGPKWFQIYMLRDMEINRWLVKRARAAGFSAIVLTADALGPGQSDDFLRLGRPFPPNMGPGNHDPALGGRGNFEDKKRDLSYSDIGFLREASGLPVIVKGLLNVEDVRQSLAAGASAIWVSNHGGRQIDGVPASISMLRAAVDAVEGRAPVILDSGVRRGIDVFKAIALGATAVAVGRPVLWASAVGGAPGVNSVYTHLAGEMKSAMLLSGVAKVGDIGREHVVLAKA